MAGWFGVCHAVVPRQGRFAVTFDSSLPCAEAPSSPGVSDGIGSSAGPAPVGPAVAGPVVGPVALSRVLVDVSEAEALLVRLRWPRGRPVCPHCGDRHAYVLARPDLARQRFKCACCRKQYSARRATILERSNVPAGRWLVALALAEVTRRSGLAARIQRLTRVSYKTAWSMVQRLEAAPDDSVRLALARALADGAVVLDLPLRETDTRPVVAIAKGDRGAPVAHRGRGMPPAVRPGAGDP